MKRWTKVISAIGSLIVLVLMFVWLTGNLSCEGKISPGNTEVIEESAAGLRTFKKYKRPLGWLSYSPQTAASCVFQRIRGTALF